MTDNPAAPAVVRLGRAGPLGLASTRGYACVMDLEGDEVVYPHTDTRPLGGGGLRFTVWARVLGWWLRVQDVGCA